MAYAADDILILAAKRTPIGKFLGKLAHIDAPHLGAHAIAAALSDARTLVKNSWEATSLIDQVMMGQVLQAGCGQAPARQAALYAGLPKSIGAITLNKVCGSGMASIMAAANGIKAHQWRAVIAGGMESMSQAPHLLKHARTGKRLGHAHLIDAMIHDGLWDPYGDQHMGSCAELCAAKYAFTRKAQDAYAITSYERAQNALRAGDCDAEIAAVEITNGKQPSSWLTQDESPLCADFKKMPHLNPTFDAHGTITAANASSLSDGAAAVVLARGDALPKNISPLARIVSYDSVAQEPEWFTTAPRHAAQLALDRADLSTTDIDLWEVNEAFAVVAMAFIHDLKLNENKVNIRGGAIALGHPIGCTGARIVVTLLHSLIAQKKRYGLAAICIGGGEASAIIIENLRV